LGLLRISDAGRGGMDAILEFINAGVLSMIGCDRRREGIIVKNKKALFICLIAFLLSVVAIQCYRPASETGSVEVGQKAPQFNLQDLTGHDVSLDQYKGKIVILDFWQISCPPCRISMPMLDKMQEEYSGKLSILAINLQEPKDMVRDYILKQNLHSKVLLDQDGSVGSRYGTYAIPMQFLIDQNGIVRYIMTGFDPMRSPQIIRDEINKML
jgi:thiol-disulfide isomerase/thioredoxin